MSRTVEFIVLHYFNTVISRKRKRITKRCSKCLFIINLGYSQSRSLKYFRVVSFATEPRSLADHVVLKDTGKSSLFMHSRIHALKQADRQTDRQTDRRTDGQTEK